MTTWNTIREALGHDRAEPAGDLVLGWEWRGRLRSGWTPDLPRMPRQVVQANLANRYTEREAVDDLLALWALGLHPESRELAARWGWESSAVAALKVVTEGLCGGWP
jgi:hypothetical protein